MTSTDDTEVPRDDAVTVVNVPAASIKRSAEVSKVCPIGLEMMSVVTAVFWRATARVPVPGLPLACVTVAPTTSVAVSGEERVNVCSMWLAPSKNSTTVGASFSS